MVVNKNGPLILESNQVHTTKDYHFFKSIDGNRNLNLLHLNRLKKTMSTDFLFTILIVNEKFEIIDGQHRFEVIKDLALPLHYYVCEGYGLKEVHIFNQNSKTWNADDYLQGYINLGYEDYIQYGRFKKKYNLGHNESMALLANLQTKGDINIFYSGNFKIKNLSEATNLIEKILLIEPFYDGVRRRTFILTMLSLFKNPNFEFSEFLQKLKIQPSALQDCVSVSQYKILIEEIYNYKRRDKVNLRY